MASVLFAALFVATGILTVSGHGVHSASPVPATETDADWMTKHMAEEHHADGWDAASFFTLHDFDADGFWQGDELLRTYGLMDASNDQIAAPRRAEIRRQLLAMLDTDGDDRVSRLEWLQFVSAGQTLPDLNTGPGHHGDDEYEYDIHHFEKYHDENTKLEDLIHPEDIEHFKKHDEMEDEEQRLEALEQMPIVEANIPTKFLRAS